MGDNPIKATVSHKVIVNAIKLQRETDSEAVKIPAKETTFRNNDAILNSVSGTSIPLSDPSILSSEILLNSWMKLRPKLNAK